MNERSEKRIEDPERLASQLVALTALPARWVGAPPQRIADDVASSIFHLCEDLTFVGVRLHVPPGRPALARRPEGALLGAWPPPADEPRFVSATTEWIAPVGPLGRHGEIFLAAPPGVDTVRARLLAAIAANQVEAACRTLDLERDVAQAHDRVAALGKLGALGQLVGGVAHEVRTPLTYATTNLYMLESELRRRGDGCADAVAAQVREVESALDRIGAIVQQLRKFAKSEVATRLEEDIRDLVRDALRLWRATHAGAAEVSERLLPTPPVLVDRGQVQQVILNLVQNAAEATGPGGLVIVETADELTHARITVIDDGPGMPPEVLAMLFQPLRTTKPDGLGLGLSIVRGIVEAHRGSLRVDSAPGRGTRVEVRIPRAAEAEAPAPLPDTAE